jgi:hypothetical protein
MPEMAIVVRKVQVGPESTLYVFHSDVGTAPPQGVNDGNILIKIFLTHTLIATILTRSK